MSQIQRMMVITELQCGQSPGAACWWWCWSLRRPPLMTEEWEVRWEVISAGDCDTLQAAAWHRDTVMWWSLGGETQESRGEERVRAPWGSRHQDQRIVQWTSPQVSRWVDEAHLKHPMWAGEITSCLTFKFCEENLLGNDYWMNFERVKPLQI